ncbi:tetratricopeptide repeat protein [Horticoccus sp. 23ND18S-11]|uniref:tetratricopeptide repeat protein n=1 Tax=Horticoccus sp. 23ND18S-11 TaxID=3391832 RepID=UPI0039C980BB
MPSTVPAQPATSGRTGLLFPESWPARWRAAALIVVATLLAFHASWSAPFLLDDLPAVVRNESLRSWWSSPDARWAAPAGQVGVAAGPLVRLTFVLNHAIGGLDPRGYHAVNLLLHLGTALLVFAVIDRALRRSGSTIALGAALLWTVHPLQTAAVTVVSHRTELLGGFLLLLTLHAFQRSTADGARRRSAWLTWAAVVLGVGASGVMAAAPALVLLYDRAFVAGSFGSAWRARRGLHLAMFASGLLWLALARGARTAGGDGESPLVVLLADVWAGALTAQRALWPHPLVFDYGRAVEVTAAGMLGSVVLVGIGLLVTLWALVCRPRLGFLGAWFFLTLIAGSHLPRAALQPVAEGRMYVPLVAVVVLLAVGINAGAGRHVRLAWGLVIVGAVLLAQARMHDFRSALALWHDTVAKVPGNARAHFHLGNSLAATGRLSEAVAHYLTALQLEPNATATHHNLAGALLQLDRAAEAVGHYETILRLEPVNADTRLNLAAALVRLGRMPEAVAHYERVGRAGVMKADEQARFGRALAEVGRLDEALIQLEAARRLAPRDVAIQVVLGMVLSAAGRSADAIRVLTEAVLLSPDDPGARSMLGESLLEAGRPAEALTHFEHALRVQPDQAAALHTSIGHCQLRLGRAALAIQHYEAALRLNPDDAEAGKYLALVRATVERRGLLKK